MTSTELVSVRFVSKEINGWESDELFFGRAITFLHGPNGSGKTPLILGIVFCLGYPSEFRQDIVDNCSAVELKIKIDNREYVITRYLDKKSWTVIDSITGDKVLFHKEKEFVDWFFNLASLPNPLLTSTDEKSSASVYMSTFLPLFYVNQNNGWQGFYNTPSRFIKDQYQEMVRLLFGASPKNSYQKKNDLIQEKQLLARLQEAIGHREYVLDELKKTIGDDSKEQIQVAIDHREQLKSRLNQLQENLTFKTKQSSTFETKISDIQVEIAKLVNERNELRLRTNSFVTIKSEILSEIEALNLNVEAAQSFRLFCSSKTENCKLFCVNEEAYGKSLLYLKDQLKDLENNNNQIKHFIEKVELNIKNKENEISLERAKISEYAKSEGQDLLLIDLKGVSKNLAEIETRIAFREKIEEQSKMYSELLTKRSSAKNRILELQSSSRNSSDKILADVRGKLSISVEQWLKVLNTSNVKAPYQFDESLHLTIGGEKLNVFQGSTLTRIILAYHASVIEVAMELGGVNHLGFCVLDTPMQQELKVDDLQEYITALRKLINESNTKIQICLSFSDSNIVPNKDDVIWEPKFKAEGKDKMYYLRGRKIE